MSSSSYSSPVRSPGSSRIPAAGAAGGGGGVSRLRSSSMKKPPEPLRRAVADCFASSAASSHHASTSSTVLLSEASRILRMCDILFSQLCLKVPPAKATEVGDDTQHGRVLFHMDGNKKVDDMENYQEVCTEETSSRTDQGIHNPVDHETESMAAQLLRGHAIVPMLLVMRVPAALFYWPLIQLAGAATDNIALGIAVGSKGQGNLPGATSDIRATLLLLLIGKCTADPTAFQKVGGEEFFRALLGDTDSRVAYYSSAFLLKRMMTEKPERYQHMLQNLVVRAQQSNNEKLLENPYLQMRGILQLANDLGTGL